MFRLPRPTWRTRARLVVAGVCLAAAPAFAQRAGDMAGSRGPLMAPARADTASARGEVELLRDEVADLRRELQALAGELRALRASTVPVAIAVPDAASTQDPAALPPEMLQAQVEELAQVKVEAASKFPVTLTGTILSNTVYNSGDANWLESPNIVGTAAGGSMTSTMRQSRLGFDVRGITVGSWEAKGALILDFFGGTPGFVTGPVMGLPRLLYAFGRLEHGGTALQVGQDHVMLAPRDPTSLAAFAFPQFFRAGNLYLRAPQVRLEQKVGGFTVKTGIVAPIAGDAGTSYVFAPTPGGGERSERPAFQGHLGYGRGTPEGAGEAQLGVSGHYGWIREAGRLIPASAGALDLNLRVGRVGLAGEAYLADELDAYGSGVGQPGRSEGGWIEARLAAATRLSLNGGAALDRRPEGLGRAGRLRNTSAFGNVIVKLSPEVSASLEYKWLQTRYGSGSNRANHHVNAVFAVTF
jgi:hypothetical protein